jgi:23S rRNA (uracil-5-)-methyltransferase RumA
MLTLNIGDKIKLEIRKQGINGEGIGYFNKLAIFVSGAISKEKVNCEITDIKPGYAIAHLDSVERASTKRVIPPCKYYDKCGGCQMQHIDYTEQLKMKQSILKQSLRKYTDIFEEEGMIKKTLGMKEPYGYRNKSQLPLRNMNFGISLGLYEPGSNHFVYIDDCLVQHPKVNEINKKVLMILRKNKMVANDQLNKDGVLLYLVTRFLESTLEASVTFIITKFDPKLTKIASEVINEIDEVKSVSYSVSRKSSTLVFGKKVELLAGNAYIKDRVDDMDIFISPDAFHQLNSKQMDVLYNEIAKAANLSGNEVIIDCYSGIGITSLQLAKKAQKVYGIDYSVASVKDALENAKINNITNIEMIAEHVEGALPRLLEKGVAPDIIIFDPPRSGLDQSVIQELLNAKVKKLIYVSCNPSTLAKNLNDLDSLYKVEYIQPIDMFPQTASVESVVLLKLK